MCIQESINACCELLGYVEIDCSDRYIVALNELIDVAKCVQRILDGKKAVQELKSLCTEN